MTELGQVACEKIWYSRGRREMLHKRKWGVGEEKWIWKI